MPDAPSYSERWGALARAWQGRHGRLHVRDADREAPTWALATETVVLFFAEPWWKWQLDDNRQSGPRHVSASLTRRAILRSGGPSMSSFASERGFSAEMTLAAHVMSAF